MKPPLPSGIFDRDKPTPHDLSGNLSTVEALTFRCHDNRLILTRPSWVSQFDINCRGKHNITITSDEQADTATRSHDIGLQAQITCTVIPLQSLIHRKTLLVVVVRHQAIIADHSQPHRNRTCDDDQPWTDHE